MEIFLKERWNKLIVNDEFQKRVGKELKKMKRN